MRGKDWLFVLNRTEANLPANGRCNMDSVVLETMRRMYKVVMKYPDGTTHEEDEIFESESEADDHGLYQVSCYKTGGEILHMSNPFDNPLRDEAAAFDVIEV
jgi:hypothetical protein